MSIADLVERMLAANVPHDMVVLAVRTAEESFSATLRGETAEKIERRLAADRERQRKKYQLLKVSKANGDAGHKESSAKSSKVSPRRVAEKKDDSVLLSYFLSASQGGTQGKKEKEVKKESTEPRGNESGDNWPTTYGEIIWKLFPKKRRYDKPQVMAFLAKLKREKIVTWNDLYAGVQRYAASDPGDYAKALLPWLRGHRWEVEEFVEKSNGHNGTNKRNFADLHLELQRKLADEERTVDLREDEFSFGPDR